MDGEDKFHVDVQISFYTFFLQKKREVFLIK